MNDKSPIGLWYFIADLCLLGGSALLMLWAILTLVTEFML